MMDPQIEQAIEKLVAAGYSEAEAEEALQFFQTPTDSALGLDQAALDRTVEDLIRQRGEDPETVRTDDEEADQFSIVQSAVEAQSQGLPLSDEEAEALEDTSNRDLILEAIQGLQGDDQVNYDWVYNSMQLTPGSLESSEALLSLAPILEEIAEVEFDESKDEDELVFDIKTVLARNAGNLMVQTAIAEWGRKNQVYLSPGEQQFSNLIAKGVSAERAKSLQTIGMKFDIDPEKLHDIWEGSDREDTFATSQAQGALRSAKQSPWQVAREFKQGLDMYEGSQVLAAVHVSDPELAARLREDPYSLDSGEIQRALTYAGHGEGSGEEGVESGDPQLDWLKTRLAGGYQASANVDTGAVKEAVNTLAQAWNLVGVEDVAASVAQDVISGAVARARSQLPNPFGPIQSGVNVTDSVQNAEARIRQRLRQTGDYQELFSNKHAAESEEEYARRFENRSQNVLGDDVAPVVRNAMRSGNVNTVYQQGLNTEVGDSSTRFQEILAKNAQVFREML